MPDNNDDILEQQYKFLAELHQRELQDKLNAATVGERLEGFRIDGTFDFLNTEIFEPIRQSMFAAIETGKLDPTDTKQMTQWSGLVQGIRQIKLRWEQKIKDAKRLRMEILKDSTPNEGGEPNE